MFWILQYFTTKLHYFSHNSKQSTPYNICISKKSCTLARERRKKQQAEQTSNQTTLKKMSLYKRISATLTALSVAIALSAQQGDPKSMSEQDSPLVSKLSIETRFGWQMTHKDNHIDHDGTGFRGKFVNLRLDGRIYRNFTYSWRQRLNRLTTQNFWDATDWIEVKYSPTPSLCISAGKQVVAIGGYEYDHAPINLYNCSEFWQYIDCYQIGLSIAYNVSKQDKLLLQVCNSPMRRTEFLQPDGSIGIGRLGNNTYGISLMWYGSHGWFETIYSANAFQLTNGRWINYLALGNKFVFCKAAFLELDYTNRASDACGFLNDQTVAAKLNVKPHRTTELSVKYSYDRNKDNTDDIYVLPGTSLHSVSGAVEVYPIKKYPEALRLYVAAGYSWGDAMNPSVGLADKLATLQIGAKVDIDVLTGIRYFVRKK